MGIKKYINLFSEFRGSNKSFSQEGEDLIIDRLLDGKKDGFYVDIGAFDPFIHSNTYFFYKKGWTGINVEPNPVNFSKFTKHRKRDINVNCGIGLKSGKLDYYIFKNEELNTFSSETVTTRQNQGYTLIGNQKLEIISIEQLFDQYLPTGQRIDYLSIDAEGLELDILKGNNWKKYVPDMIIIELLGTNQQNDTIINLLEENNYIRRSILYNSSVFVQKEVLARIYNTLFEKTGS